jgi:hypothetical protein
VRPDSVGRCLPDTARLAGREAPLTVRLVQRPEWGPRRVMFAIASFEVDEDGLVWLGRTEVRQPARLLGVPVAVTRRH